MLFNLLFALHILICVFMIMLVLLQQGKGADAGAIMGSSSSSSDSLFGALGSGTPVSRITTWLAIAFMITSIFLVKAYNSTSTRQSVTGVQAPTDVLEGSSFAGAEQANEVVAAEQDQDDEE